MGRDPSQLFLLIRRQIRFDAPGIASDQVNLPRNYDVEVDDSGAAALPFTLRCPSQFPHSARSWYHIAGNRILSEVYSQRLDAIGTDQFRSLGLEFGSWRT